MASLTQHSAGAYCLIRSKKSFININTFSATPTLNAKDHRASTATSFHLSFNIKKTASISNVNGYKRKDDQWRVFGSDDGSCGIAPMSAPPSVLELAKDFYKAINSKDIKQLEPLLADDCQYQDLVFYVPFEGKKQVSLLYLYSLVIS